VLFLIAALPMSIGLPIYEAVEELKRDDELLDGLELALQSSSLLEQVETAVQASSELDPIAKRRLIVALEAVRIGHYIDAAPPLSQGLERAFFALARERGSSTAKTSSSSGALVEGEEGRRPVRASRARLRLPPLPERLGLR